MTSVVFNTNQTPYYFTKTTTDFSIVLPGEDDGPQKITNLEDSVITFGRAGIVNINGVEIVFNTGDILVDGEVIEFIDKPDTIVYQTDNDLNEYTRSKSFELNCGSEFYFSNLYYVLNKEFADSLVETDNVNFRVELVRVNDGQVVGVFDNINYDRNNLDKYSNISYEVDCSGIQQGEYYLRLVTTVEGSSSFALANIMNETSNLGKRNFTKVNFTGNELPVTYELFQNYPNPFNPSTTIRYQVPEDGVVSLRIYDILGKEVKTLVNEQKTVGKYEISFDASGFASGVYIYRIQVNDFVSVKKMMLLK